LIVTLAVWVIRRWRGAGAIKPAPKSVRKNP
jgi:hypothetical protein